jgi:hypothetical protein
MSRVVYDALARNQRLLSRWPPSSLGTPHIVDERSREGRARVEDHAAPTCHTSYRDAGLTSACT